MTKKNIHKISKRIKAQIETFDQDDIVVACVRRVATQDLYKYKHLGIALNGTEIVIPLPFLPGVHAGKYSRANLEGYDKKRKDLPKISKDYSWEAPNYKGYGTHTVSRARQIFRKDFYSPKLVELKIELIEKTESDFVLKFSIEQVINRRTLDFEKELLYNLNLLQENVGSIDVFPSIATLADYKKTVSVDWEIIPIGTIDQVLASMLNNKNKQIITPDQIKVMKDRIGVMSKLNIKNYIKGTSGFLRYFGAQCGDDFVIFENIQYGNAIYVMYESWKELSQKSRIDLLNGPREGFERIIHIHGWEQVLKKTVDQYLKKSNFLN